MMCSTNMQNLNSRHHIFGAIVDHDKFHLICRIDLRIRCLVVCRVLKLGLQGAQCFEKKNLKINPGVLTDVFYKHIILI
jgi:hypothetical protein